MKIRKEMFLITKLFLSVIFLINSCGEKTNDYSGIYRSNDKYCNLEIVVNRENGNYHYKINSEFHNETGILKIKEIENELYFEFEGLFGVNPREEISGKLMNNIIIIQNYGNSMNQYLRFSECDTKFIELKKEEKD